jgi:hypothetical protein
MNQEALEGRLIAHRRILQLILSELAGTPAGDRVLSLLRERSTLQDGQEDPGAVETLGLGLELAVAEEFRRTVETLPDADTTTGDPQETAPGALNGL